MTDTSSALDTAALRAALVSQYRKGLTMLREIVESCPDELWSQKGDFANAFWQVAYHTLYFTHLYLMPSEHHFRPWTGQHRDCQHPDGIEGPADPESSLPLLPEPYGREEVLAYLSYVDALLDDAVSRLDLQDPECGFHWYRQSKLEHQLNNLRHLQHHTGQLADRLRSGASLGNRWR